MDRIEEGFRRTLKRCIDDVERNAEKYCTCPGHDFTRKRKLPMSATMMAIVAMEGNSLNKELYDLSNGNLNGTVTASAFVQQRQKILPEAFYDVFRSFNSATSINDVRLFNGYRLYAVDGSDINIAKNPDSETYFPKVKTVGDFNQFHLNAMYDILNSTYTDCVIQPSPMENENEAAGTMVKRMDKKERAIIIADRGYGALDLLATIKDDMDKDYLIRARNRMFTEFDDLPEGECDTYIEFTITTTQTNKDKEKFGKGKYKYTPGPSKFGKKKKKVYWFHPTDYPMRIRVVRFLLDSGEYETILTSLDPKTFPPETIKTLYAMRWGIETSFRFLKYAIGMVAFHARNENSVKQEIFARLLAFNLCSRIANSITIENTESLKYSYGISFTDAVHICRDWLKYNRNIDVREEMKRYLIPIRPGRKDPRKMKPKSFTFFIYRIA